MVDNKENPNNQDHFNVLRMIKNKPDVSQRELASQLGFSLGKLNYCIKALKDKGLKKLKILKIIPKKLIIYISSPQKVFQRKQN